MKALRLVGLLMLALVFHQAAWSQSKPEVQQVDTALQKINKQKTALQQQADTLQRKVAQPLDSAKGLQSKVSSKADSLQQLVNRPANKLDSAQRSLMGKWEQGQKKLQQQIDSLRLKKLPTAQWEARANKLRQSLDSLRQKIKLPDVQKLTAKAADLQTKTAEKVNALTTKATEGLTNKQKEINQTVNKLSDGKVGGWIKTFRCQACRKPICQTCPTSTRCPMPIQRGPT